MPTKYQFNITADEHDVLLRLAGRIQVEGVTLEKEQIVEAALVALQQDACVRQVLKKRIASRAEALRSDGTAKDSNSRAIARECHRDRILADMKSHEEEGS